MPYQFHDAVAFRARVSSTVAPTGPNDLVRLSDLNGATGISDGLPRGELGSYSRGTHFDGAGLPTLQQFLDDNINGRWFQARPSGASSLTIDNGTVARATAVTFRNIFLQGLTLNLQ